MVHGLSLATIRGRWLGETPFVQVSTTWALTCLETVHQRPCMIGEIETGLSDSRVGNNSVVDHSASVLWWWQQSCHALMGQAVHHRTRSMSVLSRALASVDVVSKTKQSSWMIRSNMPYVNLVTKLTPSSPNMPLFITVREVYSKPAGQIHAHTYPVLLQHSSICYWSCSNSSHARTHACTCLTTLFQDYPGEPVPER